MWISAVLDHATVGPIDVEQLLDDGVGLHSGCDQSQRSWSVLPVYEFGTEEGLTEDAEVENTSLSLADGHLTIAERERGVRAMPLAFAGDDDAVDVARSARIS